MDETELRMLAKSIRQTTCALRTVASTAENSFASSVVKRIEAPAVGDLVVETSTRWTSNDLDAVGRLLRSADEPVDFGDPTYVWDEESEGAPHPTEPVVYIRTLDGRERRWRNCEFVAAIDRADP